MTGVDAAGSSTFDRPEASPGFQMWLTTLAWQRAITAVLRPHGITHVQFVLLMSNWWLSQHAEPPTQRELAEHAGIDAMMVSQVLRRLESAGLIDRTVDPTDGRARRITLTRDGEGLVLRTLPLVEQADSDFFSPVSGPQLLGVLTQLSTGRKAQG